jgi:AcrR family transcriptional regulator
MCCCALRFPLEILPNFFGTDWYQQVQNSTPWYYLVPILKNIFEMPKNTTPPEQDPLEDRRLAVLKAAAKIFFSKGYERATTLDIATEAKVSKRLLYELFENKQGILVALIKLGTQRMQQPIDVPVPESAAAFYETLRAFGRPFLTELYDERNIAMTRLAIADATSSGVVARELATSGSGPVIAAVEKLFKQVADKKLVFFGDAEESASVFFNVLVGDVRIKLLMGAHIKITKALIDQRVELAVEVVKALASRSSVRLDQ